MASRLLAAEEALPELLPAASACRLAAAAEEKRRWVDIPPNSPRLRLSFAASLSFSIAPVPNKELLAPDVAALAPAAVLCPKNRAQGRSRCAALPCWQRQSFSLRRREEPKKLPCVAGIKGSLCAKAQRRAWEVA
jgi:hypothetical protein